MKFYDSVGPNPRVVRMFMAEKGIEMPKQTIDLRKGENREAEHLKRNPHGQMPTLGRARRMPDVDPPRRSQHLRAYGERFSFRRRS
jgi:glutathione S-transferase